MPVTALYLLSDSTPTTMALIQDRLSKAYHPAPRNHTWAFEHKLLRETALPAPLSPSEAHHHLHHQTTASSEATMKFTQTLELSYLPTKVLCLPSSTNTPTTTTNTTSSSSSSPVKLSPICLFDRDFSTILHTKLTTLWTPRTTLRGEGLSYEVDDFRVRLANIHQNQDQGNLKGVLMEVEYINSSYLSECVGLLREFVEGMRLGVVILRAGAGSGGGGGGGDAEKMGARGVMREVVVPRGGQWGGWDGEGEWEGRGEERQFGVLDTGRQYMELFRMRQGW